MKTILAYGDSLTYGANPIPGVMPMKIAGRRRSSGGSRGRRG
jgi:hypothetical protein